MNIIIGNNVLVGPSVQIYTVMHPMNWEERPSGLEFAKAITIGSDVWIGGGPLFVPVLVSAIVLLLGLAV